MKETFFKKSKFYKSLNSYFIKQDNLFLDKFDSVKDFCAATYGFNSLFLAHLLSRHESNVNVLLSDSKNKLIFIKTVRRFLARNTKFFDVFERNIVSLYNINSYRA